MRARSPLLSCKSRLKKDICSRLQQADTGLAPSITRIVREVSRSRSLSAVTNCCSKYVCLAILSATLLQIATSLDRGRFYQHHDKVLIVSEINKSNLPIGLSVYCSTALVGLGYFLSFLSIHSRKDLLDEGSDRCKEATYTGQHRQNKLRHPCL
jgi:hypothetical protein